VAVVVIQPVETKTRGGLDAEITGIDPVDPDCLKGTVDAPALGKLNVTWDQGGICRDQDPDCNLDLSDSEVQDAIETAKKLGAP
jgi:hypothetical protein